VHYGDVKLALLAYNRGPTRVKELMDAGRNPGNGYASKVMEGYAVGPTDRRTGGR
jgi:soluble lytic murein transglycosylase-like protein